MDKSRRSQKLTVISIIASLILIGLFIGLYNNTAFTGKISESIPLENTITTGVQEGEGYVTIKPIGIFCNDKCSATFPSYERISLIATASPGFHFFYWTGDNKECSNVYSSTISLSLSKNKSCFATFEKD